ncbi:hypothetical protein [Streptomyces cyaneofuscatus]
MAALAPDGTPLAAGHAPPAAGTTEIGGVGTLPNHRAGYVAGVAANFPVK